MMAPGLAAVLALGGLPGTLLSRSEGNAARGAARAMELAHAVIESGLAVEGGLSSIRPSTDFEGSVRAADLIIESVAETLRNWFRRTA